MTPTHHLDNVASMYDEQVQCLACSLPGPGAEADQELGDDYDMPVIVKAGGSS